MLDGREEEGTVEQRVAVEHEEGLVAQHTRRPAGALCRQSGQYEATGVVIAVESVIFHLERRTTTRSKRKSWVGHFNKVLSGCALLCTRYVVLTWLWTPIAV